MDNELIELLAQWNTALSKLQESSERLTVAVTEYIDKNKTKEDKTTPAATGNSGR